MAKQRMVIAPSKPVAPTIENPDEVKLFKDAYAAKHGAATSLTDEQVQKLYDDYDPATHGEPDPGKITPDRFVKAMRAEEGGHDDDDAPATVSATERERSAVMFGERLDKTHVAENISAIIKARDELKWRPAHVGFFMLKEMPREMLDGAPLPGSKQKDENGKIVNSLFDNRGPGKGSWWGDAFDSMAYGLAIIQRKAQLTLVKERDAAAPADLKAKGRKWAIKELEREDDKRTNGLRALKDGYNLIQRMAWVNENLRLIARFVTVDDAGYDDKGQLTDNAVLDDTTALIEVICTVKRRDARFTVGEFMAVKVEEVAKHEDHFANFEVVRAKKKDSGTTHIPAIKNVGMFEEAVYEIAEWGDEDASFGEALSLASKEDVGPGFAQQVVKLARFIDKLAGHPTVKKAYAEWLRRENETKKQEAEQAKADAA